MASDPKETAFHDIGIVLTMIVIIVVMCFAVKFVGDSSFGAGKGQSIFNLYQSGP